MYRSSLPQPASPSSPRRAPDDVQRCPICKLTNAMSDLKFLYNPECYHPICENCVARLFANGPNQCPYAGCHKTLRRKAYRPPTFGDLVVEREVDVRRRVAAVFNQVEDDFEDLNAYNGYLEMVEGLTMDLVYGKPKEKAEADEKLLAWEAAHVDDIVRNKKQDARQKENNRNKLKMEEDAARQRRLAEQAQEKEEKERILKERQEDLDMLAKAPSGQANTIMLKKRGQHKRDEIAAREAAILRESSTDGLTIRGLKSASQTKTATRRSAKEDTGPYDIYGGTDLTPSRYTVQKDYRNPYLYDAKHSQSHTVGGYSMPAYYARAMFDAFAGLAVFVGDEKETKSQDLDVKGVATVDAAMESEM